MKKIIAMLLAVVMILALCACGQTAAPAAEAPAAAPADAPAEAGIEPVTLKFGHANAVDTPVDVYCKMFAEKVAEYSDGAITIEVYPAGQLGSLQELQDAVEFGNLDMCCGDSSMLSSVLPELAILNLPMLVTSYDQAEKVYSSDEVNELVEKLASEHSMRQLCWWWNGFRHLCTKTPITSPADCKGIKLRSPEADIYVRTFSLLGFNPTPIPWGDTFQGIQTGIADGSDTTLEGIYNADLYTLCPYICLSSHIFSVVGVTINEDVWKSLSPEAQEIMMKAADEVTTLERQAAIDGEAVYKEKMEQAGCTFTEFSDKQEIIDLFTDYWKETSDACDANDLLNAIIEMGK